ncbi:MAG: deoxyhypusine synthase family protein, partial [Gemmatales bacterium]|nr:deoxyhypusine synthase family protein [Gemmatales bacterium]MDW8176315.1 deoxyhypusine synthase family protein [Gemmatales bacterium]
MDYLHHISHKRIAPPAIAARTTICELVREIFLSYNAGRLREACQLFVEKMLAADTVVGLSLSGALTPAGLGMSCLVPLIEAGFLDWIVSTGANIYHDTHFALGMELHQSR